MGVVQHVYSLQVLFVVLTISHTVLSCSNFETSVEPCERKQLIGVMNMSYNIPARFQLCLSSSNWCIVGKDFLLDTYESSITSSRFTDLELVLTQMNVTEFVNDVCRISNISTYKKTRDNMIRMLLISRDDAGNKQIVILKPAPNDNQIIDSGQRLLQMKSVSVPDACAYFRMMISIDFLNVQALSSIYPFFNIIKTGKDEFIFLIDSLHSLIPESSLQISTLKLVTNPQLSRPSNMTQFVLTNISDATGFTFRQNQNCIL